MPAPRAAEARLDAFAHQIAARARPVTDGLDDPPAVADRMRRLERLLEDRLSAEPMREAVRLPCGDSMNLSSLYALRAEFGDEARCLTCCRGPLDPDTAVRHPRLAAAAEAFEAAFAGPQGYQGQGGIGFSAWPPGKRALTLLET